MRSSSFVSYITLILLLKYYIFEIYNVFIIVQHFRSIDVHAAVFYNLCTIQYPSLIQSRSGIVFYSVPMDGIYNDLKISLYD